MKGQSTTFSQRSASIVCTSITSVSISFQKHQVNLDLSIFLLVFWCLISCLLRVFCAFCRAQQYCGAIQSANGSSHHLEKKPCHFLQIYYFNTSLVSKIAMAKKAAAADLSTIIIRDRLFQKPAFVNADESFIFISQYSRETEL